MKILQFLLSLFLFSLFFYEGIPAAIAQEQCSYEILFQGTFLEAAARCNKYNLGAEVSSKNSPYLLEEGALISINDNGSFFVLDGAICDLALASNQQIYHLKNSIEIGVMSSKEGGHRQSWKEVVKEGTSLLTLLAMSEAGMTELSSEQSPVRVHEENTLTSEETSSSNSIRREADPLSFFSLESHEEPLFSEISSQDSSSRFLESLCYAKEITEDISAMSAIMSSLQRLFKKGGGSSGKKLLLESMRKMKSSFHAITIVTDEIGRFNNAFKEEEAFYQELLLRTQLYWAFLSAQHAIEAMSKCGENLKNEFQNNDPTSEEGIQILTKIPLFEEIRIRQKTFLWTEALGKPLEAGSIFKFKDLHEEREKRFFKEHLIHLESMVTNAARLLKVIKKFRSTLGSQDIQKNHSLQKASNLLAAKAAVAESILETLKKEPTMNSFLLVENSQEAAEKANTQEEIFLLESLTVALSDMEEILNKTIQEVNEIIPIPSSTKEGTQKENSVLKKRKER